MTARTSRKFRWALDRPWTWVVGTALACGLIIAALYPLRPNRPADYTQPEVPVAAELSASDRSSRAVYVPVYSHIYHGGGRPHLLEVTLSIRNLEVGRALRIQSVKYYDTGGKFIRSFIGSPIELGPLGTVEYLIPQHDVSGGSGANFVVTWAAPALDSRAPLIQAVMVGREGDRSFSFVCTGVPIDVPPIEAVPEKNSPPPQGRN
jgi:hypothetical protein